MKISSNSMRHGAVVLSLAVVGVSFMAAPIASASASPTHMMHQKEVTKDWVCKYTTKPGGDERLKRGNDALVWVDSHATQGTWFKDGQTKSYVLASHATRDARPLASSCPVVEKPKDCRKPVVKTTALPTEPEVTVVCGANNDEIAYPTLDHVTYAQTGWVDGKNTVTATAVDGYYFDANTKSTTQTWELTDTNTTCPQVLGDTTDTPSQTPVKTAAVTATAPQVLEDTGAKIAPASLISMLLLTATAVVFLYDIRRKSRQQAFDAIAL